MSVVDSSSWLEFLAGGENADVYAPVVADIDGLIVPTVYLYEVFERLLAQHGEEDVLQTVGIMSLSTVSEIVRDTDQVSDRNLVCESQVFCETVLNTVGRKYHGSNNRNIALRA